MARSGRLFGSADLEGGHDAVDGVQVGVVVEAGRRSAELEDKVLQQRLHLPTER